MDAPVRPLEEARANSTFDALLKATAWPGTVHTLPGPGYDPVIAALIDRECVVYAADPMVVGTLLRTGARLGDIGVAHYVFCASGDAAACAARVNPGSDYYPDDGATLVVEAGLGHGTACRLTGPGIEASVTLRCEGLDAAFWRQRDSKNRYPMGFDILIVDGDSVAAIPRSTKVEVL